MWIWEIERASICVFDGDGYLKEEDVATESAEMKADEALSRRSGRIPALPYPPLR